MFSALIKREIEYKYNDFKDKLIIFDRCLIDQIVYPKVLLKNNLIINEIEKLIYQWIEKNPYVLIFYVPKNEEFLKKVLNFNQDLRYLNDINKAYLNTLYMIDKKFDNVIILPQVQEEQKNIIVSKIKSILK